MDRRVKERLIGASILVAIVVAVVPELLSGPAPSAGPKPIAVQTVPAGAAEPSHHVTVDLATSRAAREAPPEAEDPAPAPHAPPTTDADSARYPVAPVLPAVKADSTPHAEILAQAADSAAAAARPLESATPAPTLNSNAAKAAPAQFWAVQLGSFANRSNADKLAHQLKAKGFAANVVSGGSKGAQRYRVRIGPLADHNAAMQVTVKLKNVGHKGSIVPPAR